MGSRRRRSIQWPQYKLTNGTNATFSTRDLYYEKNWHIIIALQPHTDTQTHTRRFARKWNSVLKEGGEKVGDVKKKL